MINRGAIGIVDPQRWSVGNDGIGTPGWIDAGDVGAPLTKSEEEMGYVQRIK